MSHEWEVEALHRVYENDSGTCIEFRVCPDFPGNILMNTPDEASIEYYGPLRFSMQLEQAKRVHEALGRQIKAMENGS